MGSPTQRCAWFSTLFVHCSVILLSDVNSHLETCSASFSSPLFFRFFVVFLACIFYFSRRLPSFLFFIIRWMFWHDDNKCSIISFSSLLFSSPSPLFVFEFFSLVFPFPLAMTLAERSSFILGLTFRWRELKKEKETRRARLSDWSPFISTYWYS